MLWSATSPLLLEVAACLLGALVQETTYYFTTTQVSEQTSEPCLLTSVCSPLHYTGLLQSIGMYVICTVLTVLCVATLHTGVIL